MQYIIYNLTQYLPESTVQSTATINAKLSTIARIYDISSSTPSLLIKASNQHIKIQLCFFLHDLSLLLFLNISRLIYNTTDSDFQVVSKVTNDKKQQLFIIMLLLINMPKLAPLKDATKLSQFRKLKHHSYFFASAAHQFISIPSI